MLKQLHTTLTSRLVEYATQWAGNSLYPDMDDSLSAMATTWTWIFSFDGVADAMRFVLGTQFGIRSENWKDDFFTWFPENSYSEDGHLVHRGPRIAMIIHASPRAERRASESPEASLLLSRSSQGFMRQTSGNMMAVRQERPSTVGCAFKAFTNPCLSYTHWYALKRQRRKQHCTLPPQMSFLCC